MVHWGQMVRSLLNLQALMGRWGQLLQSLLVPKDLLPLLSLEIQKDQSLRFLQAPKVRLVR